MDTRKEFAIMMEDNYDKLYKKALEELFQSTSIYDKRGEIEVITDTLSKEIKRKREFGVEKYGEDSFQLSFDNLMNADIFTHIKEEILDAINYALTLEYRSMIEYDSEKIKFYEKTIINLIKIYGGLSKNEEK